MDNFDVFAKEVVTGLGGRDNFIHVFRCTRSIRVNYKHVKEIDEEEYRLSNQRFEEKYALFSQIVGLRN